MKTSNQLAEHSTSSARPENPEEHLETAMRDSMQLRRDLFRWKQLALESQDELKAIKSSFSWQATRIFRLLSALGERWKALCLAIAIAVFTLPVWPIIAVMMLFKTGRSFFESLLERVPSVLDLLKRVKYTFINVFGITGKAVNTRGEPTQLDPLIFSRIPRAGKGQNPPNTKQHSWLLLQLLSPQKRYLLDRFKRFDPALAAESENPEFQSLATTEASIMQLSLAANGRIEHKL